MKLNRNIISLTIAIALGVIVVILVNFYLAKEKKRIALERERQLGPEVAVVVASGNIPRGSKITNSMVKMASVRETNLQPRTISSLESVVGKVALADIVVGEQVSSTKLMSEGANIVTTKERAMPTASLAMKIPAGSRAFTIAIDDISAAGGMIRPNDYVDIIGSFPFTQAAEGKQLTQNVSVTLFQNILVLAVGRQTVSEEAGQAKTGAGNTITFALTPQQVELLNFAQDIGKLKLILRPPLETQTQSIPLVTADVLWQQILTQAGMQLPTQEAKQEPTPTKAAATVEIYRGKEKQVAPLE